MAEEEHLHMVEGGMVATAATGAEEATGAVDTGEVVAMEAAEGTGTSTA
jgi:hypothetical protein